MNQWFFLQLYLKSYLICNKRYILNFTVLYKSSVKGFLEKSMRHNKLITPYWFYFSITRKKTTTDGGLFLFEIPENAPETFVQ